MDGKDHPGRNRGGQENARRLLENRSGADRAKAGEAEARAGSRTVPGNGRARSATVGLIGSSHLIGEGPAVVDHRCRLSFMMQSCKLIRGALGLASGSYSVMLAADGGTRKASANTRRTDRSATAVRSSSRETCTLTRWRCWRSIVATRTG
jgi:hypothetical protein